MGIASIATGVGHGRGCIRLHAVLHGGMLAVPSIVGSGRGGRADRGMRHVAVDSIHVRLSLGHVCVLSRVVSREGDMLLGGNTRMHVLLNAVLPFVQRLFRRGRL